MVEQERKSLVADTLTEASWQQHKNIIAFQNCTHSSFLFILDPNETSKALIERKVNLLKSSEKNWGSSEKNWSSSEKNWGSSEKNWGSSEKNWGSSEKNWDSSEKNWGSSQKNWKK